MIEPCPFCGASSDDESIACDLGPCNEMRMACTNCGAKGPTSGIFDGILTAMTYVPAIEKWNRRVENQAPKLGE